MIEKIAEKCKDRCRWWEVLQSSGSSTPLSFKNNKLYSITERQNAGMGIRVNVEGRTGFSYTNDDRMADETLQRAIDMSSYGEEEHFTLPSSLTGAQVRTRDDAIDSFSVKDEVARGEKAIERILHELPEAQVDMGISGGSGKRAIMNSEGFNGEFSYSTYNASIGALVVMEDGVRLNVHESMSCLSPSGIDHLAEEIIQKMKMGMTLRQLPSGRYPVLFTPGAFISLLGICTSGLSARAVYKGISPYEGKLGEKMFNDAFTVRDVPLLDDAVGSYPFDDEGVEAREKALIDKGRVSTFVTDLKYAEKLGIEPTGNASRSYAALPSPGFSNILVNPGSMSTAECMKMPDRCILVEQFIGFGQSNTLTGQFTANLDLAYLVEKGEVTGRLKDCMLSDNVFDLMKGDIMLTDTPRWIGSVNLPHLYCPEVQYTSQG